MFEIKRLACRAILGLVLPLLAPLTVLGQAGSAGNDSAALAGPGVSSPRVENGLAEIVVTAQKQSENIQKVPISISVMSEQALEQSHAVNLADLQGFFPNVQLNVFADLPTTANVSIRGQGVVNPQN